MSHRAIIFGLWLLLSCVAIAPAQDAETRRRAALYEPCMIETGARYGVDPRLLWTIAFLETRFRPELVSPDGARGMMQFMPLTAARFRLTDPHDAEAAIDAAARYLRELQGLFDRRLDLVLAAYNAGEGAVIAFRDGRKLILSNGKVINPHAIKTGGVPPYRETRSYVKDGITLYLRLAGRQEFELKSLKIVSLKAPGKLSQEEPAVAFPQEITELKQGSLYVLDSSDTRNAPSLPSQISSGSIYPQ